MWLTTAVGMACGGALPLLAVATTAGYFLVAYGYPAIARHLPRSGEAQSALRLAYLDGRGVLRLALAECTQRGFAVADVAVQRAGGDGDAPGDPRTVVVRLEVLGAGAVAELAAGLDAIEGVVAVTAGDAQRARRLSTPGGRSPTALGNVLGVQVGFIGSGNMARALARGWGEPLLCTDSGSGRATALAAELGGEALASNRELAERADLVILAHKPAQLDAIAGEVAGVAKAVVSLLARTPQSEVRRAYPDTPVFRVEPNTPVAVRRGVSAFAAPDAPIDEDLRRAVHERFARVGEVVIVPEHLMSAAGACAGRRAGLLRPAGRGAGRRRRAPRPRRRAGLGAGDRDHGGHGGAAARGRLRHARPAPRGRLPRRDHRPRARRARARRRARVLP